MRGGPAEWPASTARRPSLLRRRRAVRSLLKDEMAAAEERIKLRSVEAEHFAHLLRLGRAEAARTLRVQAAERV